MKHIRYFPDQCAAIRASVAYIEQLPPDTKWSLWLGHENDDATLNIYVQPGETKDFRMMLGLHDYATKGQDFVSYTVDKLTISIVEEELL